MMIRQSSLPLLHQRRLQHWRGRDAHDGFGPGVEGDAHMVLEELEKAALGYKGIIEEV